MTTAQLVTAVRARLGEDTAATSQVSNDQIVDFLNAAQMELCAVGNILPVCATIDLTSGVQDYALPSNFHRIQAVYIYRTTGTLKKDLLSPKGILQREPTKPPGDPEEYYVWGANDSITGLHTYYIGFDPIPNYTTTDTPIEIFYRRVPTTMASSGTDPEVDLPWQRALIEFACYQVYQRWSNAAPQYMALMDRCEARWRRWLDEAQEYIPTIVLDRAHSPLDTMGYTSRRIG